MLFLLAVAVSLVHFACSSTNPASQPESVASTQPAAVHCAADRDHPIYRTSFDDPRELDDWLLEGGRRAAIQGGNLVLECDTASQPSESSANHLVCWLKREIPADFYLEFTVRPANRKR